MLSFPAPLKHNLSCASIAWQDPVEYDVDLWNDNRPERKIVHIDLSELGGRQAGMHASISSAATRALPLAFPSGPVHCSCLTPLIRPCRCDAAAAVLDNSYVPAVEVVGGIANSVKSLTALLKASSALQGACSGQMQANVCQCSDSSAACEGSRQMGIV